MRDRINHQEIASYQWVNSIFVLPFICMQNKALFGAQFQLSPIIL